MNFLVDAHLPLKQRSFRGLKPYFCKHESIAISMEAISELLLRAWGKRWVRGRGGCWVANRPQWIMSTSTPPD